MELVGRFGTLRIAEDCGRISVKRNGEDVFDGKIEEFVDVLERHKKFMDYIDSCEGDDEQLD